MSEPRVALVTGAGKGIGRAIAVALAERDWLVALNYHADQSAAQETLRQVEKLGARGMIIQADISRLGTHEGMVRSVLEGFGRIDLLVNNAGIAPRQRADLLETTEASFDEVLGVNLRGPFFLTQRVVKIMLGQRSGMVINIGSISAYTSSLNRGEYCIAKAGLAMSTQLFADRLAEHGIPVFEVRPGIIETDMTEPAHEKYDRLIASGLTPIQRWGQPDDVARAVLALAEGHFTFTTGQVINVDGGFHIRRL